MATELYTALTVDNYFSEYISTSDSALGTLIASGTNWQTTYTGEAALTQGTTYYLHVVAANISGPDGFLGGFTLLGSGFQFANGAQTLTTDSTDWRASPTTDPSLWVAPTGTVNVEGPNGSEPWNYHSDIAASADWIWSNPDNGYAAFFSTTITPVQTTGTGQTISWMAGASGDWSTGSNWSGGVAPGSLDTAILGGSATYTVTIDLPSAVQAVTMADAGASLDVDTTLVLGGTLTEGAGQIELGSDGSVSVRSAVVLSGGQLDLVSGAAISGAVTVSSGGVVSGPGFLSGQVVDAGVVNGVTLGGSLDVLTVSSGGVASAVTVSGYQDAVMVASRGVARGTVVSGGTQIIAFGGVASGTVVRAGGEEIVSSGGQTSGAVVSSGGLEYLSSGGAAASVTISSGGLVDLSVVVSHGQTVVAGSPASGVTVLGGVIILAGGSLQLLGMSVLSGGTLDVASGAVFSSGGTVSSGGTLSGPGALVSGVVYDYGAVVGLTMGVSGQVVVESGGLASAVTVEEPYLGYPPLQVQLGGRAIGTVISVGEQDVYGVASGTHIYLGSEYVESGGVTVSTTIASGGIEFVSSGGVASAAVVSSGGYEAAVSGGSVVGATVLSGGIEALGFGAIASNVTVSSGGAAAINLLVSSGVTFNLLAAQSATTTIAGVTALSGAEISVQSAIVLSGGVLDLNVGALVSGGVTVSSGGLLSGAGGLLGNSQDLGKITGAVVVGSLAISAGGVAAGLIDGGVVTVSSGGEAGATVVANGGQERVMSGGVGLSTTIQSAGTEDVLGLEQGITVEASGGAVADTGGVISGGTDLGYLEVALGGLVEGLTVSGQLRIFAGGAASGLHDLGNILDFGSATATVVGSGGEETASLGGTTLSAQVGVGGVEVVAGGGVASAASVASGGLLEVQAGGDAVSAMIARGGSATFASGFQASGVTVASGGVAELYVLVSGGATVTIVSAGSAAVTIDGVTTQSGGAIELLGGEVQSGGTLGLAGGVIAGPVTVDGGGTLSGFGVASALITNVGTLEIAGGVFDLVGSLAGPGSAVIGSGATLRISGGSAAEAVFDNGGDIIGAGTILGPVANSGVVEASGGALTIEGALSGTGALEIGGDATLDIQAASGDAGAVTFEGAGSILEIGSLANYALASTLTGFAVGDAVILDNTTLTSAAYTQTGANTGILELLDGASLVDSLELSGNYAGQAFFVTQTANGGSAVGLLGKYVALAGVLTPLSGFSVSDTNPNATSVTATLTDTLGELLASNSGGGTVSGSGTATLTISGTLAQVNADLATLEYQAGAAGTDTITVNSVDNLGTKGPQSLDPVSVLAVTPPIITTPASVVGTDQGAATAIPSLSIAFADGAAPEVQLNVTLTDSVGDLSVNTGAVGGGGTVGGSGTNQLSITGTLAQIDADLATLTYVSTTAGSDTINVAVTSTQGGDATPESVDVVTLAPPEITAPASAGVVQGNETAVAISLAEPGNIAGETFTLTVSDTNGVLAASGTGVTGSGTTSLSITGSLTDVNAALGTLTDTDAGTAQDTINLKVTDSYGQTAATSTSVTVTPLAPQFTAPATLSVVAGIGTSLGLSIAEPSDFVGGSVTATINDSYGSLYASDQSGASVVISAGDPEITITGTATQVNDALCTLTYTGAEPGQADMVSANLTDNSGHSASASIQVNGSPSGSSNNPDALMAAILAMDSYNRGYGATVNVTDNMIGNYTIQSMDPIQSIGFYAVSYTLDSNPSDFVISYRGTDMYSIYNSIADIVYGWLGGGGILAPQFAAAAAFYQQVTGDTLVSGPDANVFLTGHSLGGGLAGYIATLTGDSATVFDSMPYSVAAFMEYINEVKVASIANIVSSLLFGSPAVPNVPLPNESNITTEYTSGEILQNVRLSAPKLAFVAAYLSGIFGGGVLGLVDGNSVAAAAYKADISLSNEANNQPALNAFQSPVYGILNNFTLSVELHNPALLVLLQYAGSSSNTEWQNIGSDLFSAYFNDEIGTDLELQSTDGYGSPSEKMLTEIAYSAVEGATTAAQAPYGTTAIKSLFSDADKIGQFFGSSSSSSAPVAPSAINESNNPDITNNLTQIIVEYAGLLASNVDMSNPDGIVSYGSAGNYVNVDLSDSKWSLNDAATVVSDPEIVSESSLLASLFFNTQFSDTDSADNIVIGTGNNTVYTMDLYADTGTDMIYAGDGTVTTILGTGMTDYLAGAGADTLQLDNPGEGLCLTGGAGSCTVDAYNIDSAETLNVLSGPGAIEVDMGPKVDVVLDTPTAAVNGREFTGTIAGFDVGNVIDVQYISSYNATATLAAGNVLNVKGGNGSTSIQLSGDDDFTGDYFDVTPDGDGGVDIRVATLAITPVDPTVGEDAGSITFTITRGGDLSAAYTTYVSTTDGSTVPGEDINTGDFTPLLFDPVTFAAGAAETTVTVTLDNDDDSDATKTFGLQATDGNGSTGTPTILGADLFNLAPTNPPAASPPTPPTPPTGPIGGLFPDPHLTTFDGLYYSFQTAGEFVLVKDTNGGTFQVQARLSAPVGATSYSVITEIGIQVGGDVVTIDSTRAAPVWVDGKAITFSGETYALANGLITQTASGYVVTLDTGESVRANFTPGGAQEGAATTSTGITTSVSLAVGAAHDSVEGLLGDYSGNAQSDLTLADGTPEPTTMSTATLYGVYANSWRVTQATSLLDYGAGQTTATFTNTNYPGSALSVASFPTLAVNAAAKIVAAAGITDPGLVQAAIYDYLITGDASLLSVEANLQQQGLTTSAQSNFVAPTPSTQIGILASGASQTEAATGATALTFEVYRTGDTSQSVSVDYTVAAPDDSYLGAGDFGGTLPSGVVTLAAGQTSDDLTISLPDGIGAAVAKTLLVQVSAAAPVTVIGGAAQETIVNSAPVAGVAPQFGVELSNDPTLLPTQNGTAWTFNLGAYKQNETPSLATLSLAVLNMASAGGDNLAASIVASTSGALATDLSPSVTGLAPGGMSDFASVAVSTIPLGAHSITFTFTPYDTNVSGYAGVMPIETVTVSDTVYALAQASLTSNTVALGAVRVGAVDLQALAFSNAGPSGAENLDASIGTITGAAVGSGSVSLLAAGKTSSALEVGLNSASAGAFSGTVQVNLSSDGSGVDGLASTALSPQTVTVAGSVYREAEGQITPSRSVVHVGDPGTETLVVSNTDPADGYSEGLEASVVSASGGLSVTGGPTGLIAAGASDSTSLTATFSTASAGTITGGVVTDFVTDGAGTSGLAPLDLGDTTTPVTITVDNYAKAAFEDVNGVGTFGGSAAAGYTLNLGTVQAGSTPLTVDLGALNAAPGLADLLSGAFTVTGSTAFTNTGFTAFSGLGAGQANTAPTVALATGQAGVFSETITLAATGSNASGYSGALTPVTLTITGTVGQQTQTVVKLTTKKDTVTGSNLLIEAATKTLSKGDVITPGGTDNTLDLIGGGTFDMLLPTKISNVDQVEATEGAGAALPTITLSPGLDAPVTLASGTAAGSGAKIIGAANDDSAITLGDGTDTVTLGSSAETAIGGGGNDTFYVAAATIGAAINGGSGRSTLVVNGGGTAVMGAKITNIAAVSLTAGTVFTANGLNLTITGSKSADTITAGSGTDVITGGGGADTLIAGSGVDTFRDTTANLAKATIENFAAGDVIDLTNLKPSTKTATTATWSAGVLTVAQGKARTLIKLPGTFTGTFNASPDGTGGTDIRYTPAPLVARTTAFAQAMAAMQREEGSGLAHLALAPHTDTMPRLFAGGQP